MAPWQTCVAPGYAAVAFNRCDQRFERIPSEVQISDFGRISVAETSAGVPVGKADAVDGALVMFHFRNDLDMNLIARPKIGNRVSYPEPALRTLPHGGEFQNYQMTEY